MQPFAEHADGIAGWTVDRARKVTWFHSRPWEQRQGGRRFRRQRQRIAARERRASIRRPGGFIDFTVLAETVIFVLGWMRGGEIVCDGGGIHIRRRGAPKFVRRVAEVTFNGQAALRAGKTALYATPVGLFRLTQRGVELTSVMPGIDVRGDVLARTRMRIVLPASGEPHRLPASMITGHGFSLPIRRRAKAVAPLRR